MKRFAAPAVCCLLTGLSHAQPVVEIGQMSFTPGDEVVQHYCQYVPPGAAGSDQSWDLSNLVTQGTLTTSYVDPATTPNTADFPDATVACMFWDEMQYYRGDAAGYTWLGSGDGSYVEDCGEGKLLITYPFTMGSSFSDSSTCPLRFDSITYAIISRAREVQADGYGTLHTPYGPVNNVLRIRCHEHGNGNGSSYLDDAWLFVKPGIKEPLVTIWSRWDAVLAPDTLKYAMLIDASIIGVDELFAHDIGLSLTPNPADEMVTITFSAPVDPVIRFEVLDMQGRQVSLSTGPQQLSGICQRVLDISVLEAGAYVLRVRTSRGEFGSTRFVKR